MDDLTIITNVLLADGIGRQGIGLAQTLMNDLSINSILFQPSNFAGLDENVQRVLRTPVKPSKVSFWTYILGLDEVARTTHAMLQSPIKIAYSMFESSAIPQLWVDILNKYYDIVVVPDQWLVDVYKSSGVKIPIFVLPLGIIIDDDYLKYEHKKNKVFTFGMTGSLLNRKNHIKLMRAFLQNFKGNQDVRLKIHGRFGAYKDHITSEYRKLRAPKNIDIITGIYPQEEYKKFMLGLDCYVFISKGEGFSITPREMIACGKPCILTNNTAHKTICQSGLVYPVKAEIKENANYEVFGNKNIGYYYDCKEDDVAKAMLDVYKNYNKHLEKVKQGRDWVRQYTWDNLKNKYLSLIKPKNIVLSDTNEILDDCLKINDIALYNKYIKVFAK